MDDMGRMDESGTGVSRREVLAGAVAAGVGATLLGEGCAPHEHSVTPSVVSGEAGSRAVLLKVNGAAVSLQLEPRVTLLDALREYAGLTGTKKGCDHGQCGTCTVLVDGVRINSCLTLAVMHEGEEITTVEGLAKGGDQLHPVQAAFIEHDAFQCGYCTPGQICSAVGLISEAKGRGERLSDDAIREGMAGNLCRCGAYVGIVAAVREAAGAA